MKERVLRYWAYLRRGHSIYLAFLISFINFIVIQYRLLIEKVGFLHNIFKDFTMFAVITILTYIPLTIFLGWLDYRRLSFPIDTTIQAKNNPATIDIMTALYLIADSKNDEAKKILEKWVEKQ